MASLSTQHGLPFACTHEHAARTQFFGYTFGILVRFPQFVDCAVGVEKNEAWHIRPRLAEFQVGYKLSVVRHWCRRWHRRLHTRPVCVKRFCGCMSLMEAALACYLLSWHCDQVTQTVGEHGQIQHEERHCACCEIPSAGSKHSRSCP